MKKIIIRRRIIRQIKIYFNKLTIPLKIKVKIQIINNINKNKKIKYLIKVKTIQIYF